MKRTCKTYRVEIEQVNGDVVKLTATLANTREVEPVPPTVDDALVTMFGGSDIDQADLAATLRVAAFAKRLKEAGVLDLFGGG